MTPPATAPARGHTLRRRNSTLEKILRHAREYVDTTTRDDPRGAELQRTAIARHTQRAQQRSASPDAGVTMLPSAMAAIGAAPRTARPRIVQQPADAEATAGMTAHVALDVVAHVRPCTSLAALCTPPPAALLAFAWVGLLLVGARHQTTLQHVTWTTLGNPWQHMRYTTTALRRQ